MKGRVGWGKGLGLGEVCHGIKVTSEEERDLFRELWPPRDFPRADFYVVTLQKMLFVLFFIVVDSTLSRQSGAKETKLYFFFFFFLFFFFFFFFLFFFCFFCHFLGQSCGI